MPPPHIGVGLALYRTVAEITPTRDHLFGRATADAELQTATGDEVRRARILNHIQRVLVTHVDYRRADFYAIRLRTDCRQQGERRGKLAGEMMHPEERAVHA